MSDVISFNILLLQDKKKLTDKAFLQHKEQKMGKRFFYTTIIIIAVVVSLPTTAQQQYGSAIYQGPPVLPSWRTQQCQQWTKLFGEWNNEQLSAMQPAADGGFVLAGHNDGLPANPLWIVKTDANGLQQWYNSYAQASYSQTRSLQLTADGGYILAGYTQTTDRDHEVWILKLNSSGGFQWQKNFGGANRDEAYCISLTSDGGYIVSASTLSADGDVQGGAAGGFNYWILKLDSDGNLQWQKKLEANQRPYAVKQTNDGGYIIAGDSPTYFNLAVSSNDPYDEGAFNIIKLNTSGDFVWQVTLGTHKLDGAYDIIQAGDGNYVAAGYTNNSNSLTGDNFDGLIVKISPSGNILWQTRVDYTVNDEIKNIRQTADGGFIFCGSTVYQWNDWYGTYDPSDFWVGKIDAAGQLVWQGALAGEREGAALAVAPTSDGGYAVAGSCLLPDNAAMGIAANLDYLLIKLTPGCVLKQVSGHYTQKRHVPYPIGTNRYARSVTANTGTPVIFKDEQERLIASVISAGSSPVGGEVTSAVWVDTVQSTSYLRRHYQITPDENATTATGIVKLYFSQQDFDEYNRVVSNDKKLPVSPVDMAGIANFRIIKYGGTSNNETGLPDSYNSGATLILPDEMELIWNSASEIWEASFPVSGFSGFFATDAVTAAVALPVTFGAINAFLKDGVLTVNWTTEKESNNAYYLVEASTDGTRFKTISGKILTLAKDGSSEKSLHYSFSDAYAGVFGASAFLLLSLMGCRNRRLWKNIYIFSALLIFSAVACNKSSRDLLKVGNSDIFVRIVQTDKDGTQTYSKTVKVIHQ